MVSDDGRRFRVRFNPAGRLWAGVADALGPDESGGLAPQVLELSAGFSYRAVSVTGEGTDTIAWHADHRILAGFIQPQNREADGVPALDVALYSVSALRHDKAPRVVLPSSPPVSIPFPFDIGFEIEAGRVFVPSFLPESAAGGSRVPMLRVGVLRATAFLDPWRSGRPGRSLEIGVGARYDVEPFAVPSFEEATIVHRIAPMTATSLRFRFQSDDGLTVLDCRGDLIPHWTSDQTWEVMASAGARVERTLIAVSDQPVSAVFEGGYRRAPDTSLSRGTDDFRLSLGLTFNLQIQ